MPIPALAIAAMKYGPAAYSAIQALFGGRKKVDYGELQRWLATQHAEGSLSPQDYAAADLTQSRLADTATSAGRMAQTDAVTRMRQRGIDLAPASEATLARVNAQTARGRQAAGDTAASQLYDTWLGNKQFDQAKIMALASGRIGGASGEALAANTERAGNINSLLDYIPSLIPKSGGVPTSTFATDLSPDSYGGAAAPGFAPRGAGPPAQRMVTSGLAQVPRLRGSRRFNPASGMLAQRTDPYDYGGTAAPRLAAAGGGWSSF